MRKLTNKLKQTELGKNLGWNICVPCMVFDIVFVITTWALIGWIVYLFECVK